MAQADTKDHYETNKKAIDQIIELLREAMKIHEIGRNLNAHDRHYVGDLAIVAEELIAAVGVISPFMDTTKIAKNLKVVS